MKALLFISQCCKFSVFNLALIKVLHFRPHDDESFAIAKLTMMKVLYFSCHNDIRSPFLILQWWKLSIFYPSHNYESSPFPCSNDRSFSFLISQQHKFSISHLTIVEVLHLSSHNNGCPLFLIAQWWKFVLHSHLTMMKFSISYLTIMSSSFRISQCC